ncbi:MAG: DJ-1/PfpI family protein, partial [Eggerthellaceae bacterium]|nr:DJ-1/PfpI family protein [Eggerthellaceae bacterium]
MSKSVLLVIAKEIFRDEEYLEPKQILEDAGIQVTTASTEPGPCKGKLGATATADISVKDAAQNTYDAVVFIGGGGAEAYIDNPIANSLVDKALASSEILAAICLAPSILAHADALRDIRATAWEGQEQDL